MSGTSDNRLLLGQVAGAFGIQGWVKIISHTEPRENIFTYVDWSLHAGKQHKRKLEVSEQTVKVLQHRKQGKGLVARLQGIEDRTAAESLQGLEIFVDAKQLKALPENDYYWRDLIGLQVLNDAGFGCKTLANKFRRCFQNKRNFNSLCVGTSD